MSAAGDSAPPSGSILAVVEKGSEAPVDPCGGSMLDLDVLLRKNACRLAGHAVPPPDDFVVRVEPAEVVVASGASAEITVVIENTGAAPGTFDLDVGCGEFSIEVYDHAGRRADYVNTTCGFGRGCGRGRMQAVVAPGGTARKVLEFRAEVTEVDENCREKPGGSMRPGRYELRVSTPVVESVKAFDYRVVTAKLVVQ
jgi:hypothetical protein